VIERVVENWLTSVNERQYQIPFCQLLAAEGETVIYISPHGQREQGKDVITLGRDRVPRAYQLKAGRVALADWRKYHGEINELVIYPVDHPSIHSKKQHLPFFVTNGTVADPVLSAIPAANHFWRKSGAKPLTLLARDELVSRFVKAHGSYLPSDPANFGVFLDLVVKSGRDPFPKSSFARFLESILPFRDKPRPKNKDIERALASAVLLTTYVTQGCVRESNHWALFEAWTVAASYILGVAEHHGAPPSCWTTPFELAELGAIRALQALAEECEANKMLFTQGNPLTDGTCYAPRITILCGLLAALNLHQRLRNLPVNSFVRGFLNTYLHKVNMWGESAVPYLWAAALESEQYGRHSDAEGLILLILSSIVSVNAGREKSLPNPYYGPEESIRLASGLEPTNREMFDRHSYTAEPLIDFLARRLLRRHLASIWEKVTRIHFTEFSVKDTWEWFRWRAQHGSLKTTIPGMPQSWKELLAHATTPPQGLPRLIYSRPEFAVLFGLVFPHRFTCDMAKLVERSLGTGCS
jgi:hypothetical protein